MKLGSSALACSRPFFCKSSSINLESFITLMIVLMCAKASRSYSTIPCISKKRMSMMMMMISTNMVYFVLGILMVLELIGFAEASVKLAPRAVRFSLLYNSTSAAVELKRGSSCSLAHTRKK